jgi:hypothetical protein
VDHADVLARLRGAVDAEVSVVREYHQALAAVFEVDLGKKLDHNAICGLVAKLLLRLVAALLQEHTLEGVEHVRLLIGNERKRAEVGLN